MAKIILITHQKGGVGKSTLTFNLAQNFSSNSKVAVLDFDLQGSLSQLKVNQLLEIRRLIGRKVSLKYLKKVVLM